MGSFCEVGAFGGTVLAVLFALALSPWLAGKDFGVLKIPSFRTRPTLRRKLACVAPLACVLAALVALCEEPCRELSFDEAQATGQRIGEEDGAMAWRADAPAPQERDDTALYELATASGREYVATLSPPLCGLSERVFRGRYVQAFMLCYRAAAIATAEAAGREELARYALEIDWPRSELVFLVERFETRDPSLRLLAVEVLASAVDEQGRSRRLRDPAQGEPEANASAVFEAPPSGQGEWPRARMAALVGVRPDELTLVVRARVARAGKVSTIAWTLGPWMRPYFEQRIGDLGRRVRLDELAVEPIELAAGALGPDEKAPRRARAGDFELWHRVLFRPAVLAVPR